MLADPLPDFLDRIAATLAVTVVRCSANALRALAYTYTYGRTLPPLRHLSRNKPATTAGQPTDQARVCTCAPDMAQPRFLVAACLATNSPQIADCRT
ncbi:hypothetical protein [Streptomyces sp. MUSC 125]|uniref:hypothetical protein n=1 Tax=Streptomyces sp. MUSC 125 TaxID=1428624 RepID=UPI00131B6BF0|nr:hypothetical protein [Streptomyces sp. MUSC 125]